MLRFVSQIRLLSDATMATQLTRNPTTLLKFLEEMYGLDTVQPNATSVPYGFLLYLIVQDKKYSQTETTRRLSRHIGYDVDSNLLYSVLRKLNKRLVLVKKRLSSDSVWTNFTTFLQEVHAIIPLRPVVDTPPPTIIPIPSPSDPPVARMTRQDCDRCVTKQRQLEFSVMESKQVRDELRVVKEELKNVKAEVTYLKEVIATKEILTKNAADALSISVETIKRKTDIENRLRVENTSLKQQMLLRKEIKDPSATKQSWSDGIEPCVSRVILASELLH